MPNCFQLIDKVNGKPIAFAEIDERMCEHFGVESDPDNWYLGWYNVVGLSLAVGMRFDEIVVGERMRPVIDWLEANYTPSAWAER